MLAYTAGYVRIKLNLTKNRIRFDSGKATGFVPRAGIVDLCMRFPSDKKKES